MNRRAHRGNQPENALRAVRAADDGSDGNHLFSAHSDLVAKCTEKPRLNLHEKPYRIGRIYGNRCGEVFRHVLHFHFVCLCVPGGTSVSFGPDGIQSFPGRTADACRPAPDDQPRLLDTPWTCTLTLA